MHCKTIVQIPLNLNLPVSAMHIPASHTSLLFWFTLEIEMSNKAQYFNEWIAADDQLSLYELRAT